MDDLYQKCTNDHKEEIRKIEKENEEYIAKYKSKGKLKDVRIQPFQKNIIPSVNPIPRFSFYRHIDRNIGTRDDPVLRYTPFIGPDERLIDLSYYETVQKEYILNRKEEINNRVIAEFAKNIDKKALFNILTVEKSCRTDLLSDLNKLSIYTGLSIKQIIQRWEMQQQDKSFYDDSESFKLYFCNICLLFDCNVHEQVAGEIEKQDFNSNDRNKTGKTEKLEPEARYCSESCYKKTPHPIINKAARKATNVPSSSSISKDIMTAIYKNFNVTPCQALKIYNYFAEEKTTCKQIARHIERSGIQPKNIRKKQEPKKSTFRKIALAEIYTPCSHGGMCMNNSACICYKKKVFCEKFCFCECCNNIFKCRCNICDLDCPCLNFSRECSDCECSSCSNNNLLENKTKATFVDESTIAGYGLFAGEDILANEFVIEYIGEVITNEETERRGVFYEEKKLSYLFNLNQKGDEIFQTIDAT
ncbi:Histone-lysine N-methyltransferase MEDEA, partial [Dictyocoela roeselum]